MVTWEPQGCIWAEGQPHGYSHVHGRDCDDDRGQVWVERTDWRERVMFNMWRRPFPHLFQRWDCRHMYVHPDGRKVRSWAGYSAFTRRAAQRWADEVNAGGDDAQA
jgi:hypothetical protein